MMHADLTPQGNVVEVQFYINGVTATITIPASQVERFESYLQNALLNKLNEEIISFCGHTELDKVAFKIQKFDGYCVRAVDPSLYQAAKLQSQLFKKIDKHLDAQQGGEDWKNED